MSLDSLPMWLATIETPTGHRDDVKRVSRRLRRVNGRRSIAEQRVGADKRALDR